MRKGYRRCEVCRRKATHTGTLTLEVVGIDDPASRSERSAELVMCRPCTETVLTGMDDGSIGVFLPAAGV